jgi:hypothetical protein
MRRFLEFIVEETLAGRESQLCEYAVALSVFERGESFSPGLDPIVRNDARRLRQKLLEYYHRSPREHDDQIIIDVPKGGYVPTFRAASDARATNAHGNYRLVASLIRLEDGVELWNTERILQFNEKSEQPGFYIAVSGETSARSNDTPIKRLQFLR